MAHLGFGLIPGLNTVMAFRDPTAGPWEKAFALAVDAASVVTFGMAKAAAAAKGVGTATKEGAAAAARGGEKLTTLYRTVGEAERQTVHATGRYSAPLGGVEGKYFYPTVQQAEALARANFSSQGVQTLTSIQVPNTLLRGASSLHVAGEGRGIFMASEQLQALGSPQVWTYFPTTVGF